MVLGLDLGKDRPIGVAELIDEEVFGRGERLANGLRFPLFDRLDVKEVVTELRFRDQGRITAEVLMNETHVAVVGGGSSLIVVPQHQSSCELGH